MDDETRGVRRQRGSVRELPSGRWQARVTTPEGRVNGPRTFDTQGAATAWLCGDTVELSRKEYADLLDTEAERDSLRVRVADLKALASDLAESSDPYDWAASRRIRAALSPTQPETDHKRDEGTGKR